METIPTTLDEFKAYVRSMFDKWYESYERGFSEETLGYAWSNSESPCRFAYYHQDECKNYGWFIAIGAFRGAHRTSIHTAWSNAKHRLKRAPVL